MKELKRDWTTRGGGAGAEQKKRLEPGWSRVTVRSGLEYHVMNKVLYRSDGAAYPEECKSGAITVKAGHVLYSPHFYRQHQKCSLLRLD